MIIFSFIAQLCFFMLGAQLKDYHQGMVHYHLPDAGQSWARIFGVMESAKTKYQIEDYSVGQTTLEQVSILFILYLKGRSVNTRSSSRFSSTSRNVKLTRTRATACQKNKVGTHSSIGLHLVRALAHGQAKTSTKHDLGTLDN